jgi:hypothetical protein
MRRSWPANLIAAVVVSATLGVGALGALGSPKLGSPKANSDAGRTSRGPVATESPIPACSGRFEADRLVFDCPSGWFVWQNSHFDDDPYAQTQVIISNHRPLEQGSGGLPDGWFKVDMYVGARDPHKTFEQLASKACASPDDATLESCEQVTIAGHTWVQKIERDPFTHYRSIATVVDGVEIHVVAIIPDGPQSTAGTREIDALFVSLSIH